jgi:two-component system copper resistance phosphate regulon response regulator CusR
VRLLIIEDDSDFATTLREILIKSNYIVDLAFTGTEGIEMSQITSYDLIIIDIMLPDMSGIEVCQELRGLDIYAPVLMLTARFELEYKVDSFDSGADDYLTKPFKAEELLARIRSLLRRSNGGELNSVVVLGGYCGAAHCGAAHCGAAGDSRHEGGRRIALDTRSRQLVAGTESVDLSPKEYGVLEYLVSCPKRPISKLALLEAVWEDGLEVESNVVEVTVNRVRKVLGRYLDKPVIKTVYGVGYRFDPLE